MKACRSNPVCRIGAGLLFGRQNHEHGAALESGQLFDRRNIGHGFGNLVEQLPAAVRQRDFTASEDDRHPDFVLFFQKFSDMADLDLQIMVARFRANFDLFQLESTLFLFRFLQFFSLLVLVLSIIHYFADGRFGIGRYLHQVKAEFSGSLQCLVCRDNADLIAVGIDDPDFSCPDLLVDIYPVLTWPVCSSYAFTS